MKKSFIFILSFLLILVLITGCVSGPENDEVIPTQQTTDKAEVPDSGDTEFKDDAELTEDPTQSTLSGQLKAHFIDVGQGDAVLIQTPTQNILIDGGNRDNTTLNYIKAKGISSLDLVIGTHPHADHIGGLINVFEAVPIKEVIDPTVVHTTKTFEDYLTIIDKKEIKFTEGRAGMARDIGGGAKLEILHPASPSGSHLNDASIVVKITFDRISFMLTGDVEEAGEREILLQGKTNLKSTILKVGHHGSGTSTSNAFLNAVNPEAAVIMAGADNKFGHPHEETLTKLYEAQVDIYMTHIHGTIEVTTDGRTYDINVKQSYQYVPQKEPDPDRSNL